MADELTIQKNAWQRLREYVADVRTEMKRVTWPGKQETYGTTVMVILTTFAFAAYFALCDKIFGAGVLRLLHYLTRRG
jgi:preprotein translocase subunit SecE